MLSYILIIIFSACKLKYQDTQSSANELPKIKYFNILTGQQDSNHVRKKKYMLNKSNLNSDRNLYISEKENLLLYIKEKYKYRFNINVKGTEGGSSLHYMVWALNLIREKKITNKKDINYILDKVKIITTHLKNYKLASNEQMDLSDIDFQTINKKYINKNKFTLINSFFNDLLYSNSISKNKINNIKKNILDIDKIKNKEIKNLDILSRFELLVKTYLFALVIYKRGTTSSQNETWWILHDFFTAKNKLVDFYNKFKNKINKPIVEINFLGTRSNLVLDSNFKTQIINNSPYLFKESKIKKNYFGSFMPKNVAVSTDTKWDYRRKINTETLCHGKLHKYANQYNKKIFQIINNMDQKVLKTYNDFLALAKKIVSSVIFNDKPEYLKSLHTILDKSNSFRALGANYEIDKGLFDKNKNYIKKQISNPKKNSLIKIGSDYIKDHECPYKCNKEDELVEQVFHWVFPLIGAFSVDFVRTLLFLSNHKTIYDDLVRQLKLIDPFDAKAIYNCKLLRNCVLETLRLNVRASMPTRSLKRPANYKLNKKYKYSFDLRKKYEFEEGAQFIFPLSPSLRDRDKFKHPNKFNPYRWNSKLESSYYSLQFSQGPQKCPGKELVIFLSQCLILHYLKSINYRLKSNKINTQYIEESYNPFKIKFY